MIREIDKQAAHKELERIFKEILPAVRLPERPAQLELSQKMLAAMLDSHIALCEAGTGIGKTYAYLAAALVFNKYRGMAGCPAKPICISTCSIALQEAIVQEYLPVLNRALYQAGLLNQPQTAVIRKGKAHYVCDQRLNRRLRAVNQEHKNPDNLAALLSMKKKLDMDNVNSLSSFDKRQICVSRACRCKRKSCRYMNFLDCCCSERYLFQICNHNLLLADAIHRNSGKKPILPDCCCVIIDEAHKLPEAARDMFGLALGIGDIDDMAEQLKAESFYLAAEELEISAKELLAVLDKPWDSSLELKVFWQPLDKLNRRLKVIKRQIGGLLQRGTIEQLKRLVDICDLILSKPKNVLLYTAAENGGTKLGIAPLNIGWLLGYSLWKRQQPFVITSGTLAVAGDFSRFRESAGLQHRYRVRESVAESPFDYEHNCLLYLPKKCPAIRSAVYFDELTGEIEKLLAAACGHTLVLFNSYADLSEIKERLEMVKMQYPLFVMGRSRFDTAERFKAQSGGVLLAAGTAWEGMDFPGDTVSLLVIPRLPFPFPDAKSEREKEEYETLADFIWTVVVPDMQIKLRQGFGRAIRTEADSCVVAVLDERSIKDGGRYFAAMQAALPSGIPITDSLAEVERFMREVKPESYFQEVGVNA